jgi:uncharacterized protein YbcV (DUF1398 family)
MPLEKPSDFAYENSKYCVHCVDKEGQLKPYEEILNGMAGYLAHSQGIDPAAAKMMAAEVLAKQPAWKVAFDAKKVMEISKISKAEKWPFPKTLTALKEAGVEYYDVELKAAAIIYHGQGQEMTETGVPSLQNLPEVGTYDLKALKEAIHFHQVNRTPYAEIMGEVVKAGIVRYRVDVVGRSCTYFGKNGEKYTEAFPKSIQ